jgi:hypothetical protein
MHFKQQVFDTSLQYMDESLLIQNHYNNITHNQGDASLLPGDCASMEPTCDGPPCKLNSM